MRIFANSQLDCIQRGCLIFCKRIEISFPIQTQPVGPLFSQFCNSLHVSELRALGEPHTHDNVNVKFRSIALHPSPVPIPPIAKSQNSSFLPPLGHVMSLQFSEQTSVCLPDVPFAVSQSIQLLLAYAAPRSRRCCKPSKLPVGAQRHDSVQDIPRTYASSQSPIFLLLRGPGINLMQIEILVAHQLRGMGICSAERLGKNGS